MEHSKNYLPITSAVVVFFLFVGALYIVLWSPSMASSVVPYPHLDFKTGKFSADELDLVLNEASMPNKTVIIAVVNKAYVEQSDNHTDKTMLDLFLESFWVGDDTRWLLDHLVLVAVDQTAYNRCKFKRLHCYRLITDGINFDGEKVYMSQDFIKMMWRRTLFLLDVLNRGYSFIFTDTDVMWLRNPFAKLNTKSTDDLLISVDSFHGNLQPEHNLINTGFYYIRSNDRTITLFDKWYSQKDNSTGKKEQDVLEDLMRSGIFKQLGLKVRILETRLFSGFCEDSGDVGAVTTVHANCCRHITAKVRDLATVLRDWKRFKGAVTMNDKDMDDTVRRFKWSEHIGCKNSWKY